MLRYNERDNSRAAGPSASAAPLDKSLPKMKKVPDMKDFQVTLHTAIHRRLIIQEHRSTHAQGTDVEGG